jgi:malate dehydrogenase
MLTAAIIGAGDLGGAVAHALASRDRLSRIALVDAGGSVAAGKALDIQQMGAVDGFHTRLDGSADMARIIGCDVCIVADQFGRTSSEWSADEGAAMLSRLRENLADAPVVLAGASQADLLAAAVRDARLPRTRVLGSAPEAFRSAVTGIVALEARCSPREVRLTVLGAPGRFVIPWSEASIGGYSIEHVLTQVQLTRIEARAARLWPPGVYTLGLAAARVAEAILTSSRESLHVLTLLDGQFNAKGRAGALPVLLAPHGIARVRTPALSTKERVQVESSLG